MAIETFQDMHDYIDLELDKHESPWFDAREKDIFLNEAQEMFVDGIDLESDEKAKKYLGELTRVHNISSSVTEVDYSTITDFWRVMGLGGTFTICGESVDRPIRPMQIDDYYEAKKNAFFEPTNVDPFYIEYHDGSDVKAFIKSETAPTAVEVFYLKRPTNIDGQNSPLNTPEFPIPVRGDICRIAVNLMLENIESPRMKTYFSKIIKHKQNSIEDA